MTVQQMIDTYGSVEYNGKCYALAQDAYPIPNNGPAGYEAAAYTITGDSQAEVGPEPDAVIVWRCSDWWLNRDPDEPGADDESHACDWTSPENVIGR